MSENRAIKTPWICSNGVEHNAGETCYTKECARQKDARARQADPLTHMEPEELLGKYVTQVLYKKDNSPTLRAELLRRLRAAESLRADYASLKKVHNRLMDRAKKAGLKLELYDLTKEKP